MTNESNEQPAVEPAAVGQMTPEQAAALPTMESPVAMAPEPTVEMSATKAPDNFERVPLRLYRSHKVVEAARIVGIQEDAEGAPGAAVHLILDTEDSRDQFVHRVSPDWVRKHEPRVGGYLVRYEDGYESYTPAEPFRAGYLPFNGRSRPSFPGLRTLTAHEVNAANLQLTVEVLDVPGAGGGSGRSAGCAQEPKARTRANEPAAHDSLQRLARPRGGRGRAVPVPAPRGRAR